MCAVIDRASSQYQAAKDKVKIGYFTERGHDVTGLIHVGANDGYEVDYYLEMGIKPILCFEPERTAREILQYRYGAHPDVQIRREALGNLNCSAQLQVPHGGTGGSSFLPLPEWDRCIAVEVVSIWRFASLASSFDLSLYNCLVLDVQGMELDVLRGMDEYLCSFDFLNVECSEEPIYRGEARADEVIAYLRRMGFRQETPVQPHDDVLFIRYGVVPNKNERK